MGHLSIGKDVILLGSTAYTASQSLIPPRKEINRVEDGKCIILLWIQYRCLSVLARYFISIPY